jgi:hypothetical protein
MWPYRTQGFRPPFKPTREFNLAGLSHRSDRSEVAARFSDTVHALREQTASGPYQYETQFEITSGRFELKFAFSSGADSFGSVETWMIIEPGHPARFF